MGYWVGYVAQMMLIGPNSTFIYFKIHYVYPKTLQIWKKEWLLLLLGDHHSIEENKLVCEQNDNFITEENFVYLTINNKNGAIVWSFLGAFLATNNEYCSLDMLTHVLVFLWILANLP